jgi:tetratricopeptide (TPR) repeat protein
MSIGRLPCLLGFFICALFPGAHSARLTPQDPPAIDRAEQLLDAGKPDAALDVLRTIPRPESEPRLNHFMGLAYYQKGDYARAIEYFSSAIKQTPETSRQHRQGIEMLGMAHYLMGHLKDAIPYLEQVSTWAPDNSETAYALGVSYIQTHNIDRARQSFARMFGVSAESASAYLLNAQMMIRQQFEEFAEKELRKALEIDPKLPQANFLLGEMAIYHSNLDLGIELLQKEIVVNPAFAMAYYRLGDAYTRQLKWDQAIGPLQKSVWLNPFFSGPYILLGKAYLKKGDLTNAESLLKHALKMDPNNFSGHHLLAQTLQQAGNADEAKKEFELADRLRTSSDK